MLDPFHVNVRDPIDLQKAAKRIATFVGLENLTFIIGVAKQKENVAGHIDLRNYYGTDVFIEVSNQALIFPQAVLTTLAHELTHKYLHVHNVYSGMGPENEHDNEVLTDIAAVYLGLGKLMLNGCECLRETSERKPQGIQKQTETLRTGYLTRDQFTFVYRLVCGMRSISESSYLTGLLPEARSAMTQCSSHYKHFFGTDFHSPDEISEIKKALQEGIAPIDTNLINLENHISHIEEILKTHAGAFLRTSRKRIHQMQTDTFRRIDTDIYNPSLKWLLAVQCDCDVEDLMEEVHNLKKAAEIYVDCVVNLAKIIHKYEGKFPALPATPEIRHVDGDKRKRSLLGRIWERAK